MIRYLGLRAKKIAPRAARAVRKGCFVMKIPLKPRSLCQNRRISYLSRENHKNITSKIIAQITYVPTSVGAACSCPGVQAFIARYILDPQIFRHLSRFIFDKCLPKNLAFIEKIIAISTPEASRSQWQPLSVPYRTAPHMHARIRRLRVRHDEAAWVCECVCVCVCVCACVCVVWFVPACLCVCVCVCV